MSVKSTRLTPDQYATSLPDDEFQKLLYEKFCIYWTFYRGPIAPDFNDFMGNYYNDRNFIRHIVSPAVLSSYDTRQTK